MSSDLEYFKTPKGTQLPILNLKGKPYLQVAHRIAWFREEHPEWSIKTTAIHLDDKYAIFRADIVMPGKKNMDEFGTIENFCDAIIAQAHKREDRAHFADYMEKAETGSIGRALALVGYGTQFTAHEFDEGSRLADAPILPIKKSIEHEELLTKIGALINKYILTTSKEHVTSYMKELGYDGWGDVQAADVDSLKKLIIKLNETV